MFPLLLCRILGQRNPKATRPEKLFLKIFYPPWFSEFDHLTFRVCVTNSPTLAPPPSPRCCPIWVGGRARIRAGLRVQVQGGKRRRLTQRNET